MSSVLHDCDLFVTGGAGTLGRAIAARRKQEGWKGKMTVYSTTADKHEKMRRIYPDIQYICGDIRNYDSVYMAMAGADVVLHCAAVKVIPVSEWQVLDTIDVNLHGSSVVAQAAMQLGIKKVVGISTDKAAHPCNMYGCTKKLMEGIFQEYNRADFPTKYYLVRYGNVIESTGSVIEVWKNSVNRGEKIKLTDPEMTRFWLSPNQAVQVILDALEMNMPGCIYVPRMPALSIGKLAEYTVGNYPIERIPLRPGEKKHEELVTIEETERTIETQKFFLIGPSTGGKVEKPSNVYASNLAEEMTFEQYQTLLAGI